jgi:hypothetical protein
MCLAVACRKSGKTTSVQLTLENCMIRASVAAQASTLNVPYKPVKLAGEPPDIEALPSPLLEHTRAGPRGHAAPQPKFLVLEQRDHLMVALIHVTI